MKLVRYGNPGKEKPGLIDANGQLRDLSAVVKDIGPEQLGDAALAKLRKLKTDKLPLVKGKPRYRLPGGRTSASSSPSASTTPTMRPNRACRFRPSRWSS